MKRILIFSLQYYPLVGGAEVAIKEITDRISHEEVEFHMVTLRYDSASPSEERIGNVVVHRVGRGEPGISFADSFASKFYWHKIFFIPRAALTSYTLHKKESFDGAWSMMTYMVFPLVLLRLIGVRIPYLLTLQEGDPFERVFERMRIRLFSPLLFYGIRHAARVQAISYFLGDWARACGYKGTISIVPNGVSLAAFSKQFSAEEIMSEKKKLGKNDTDIFLVTTSRLVHKNGVDDVIRALPTLSSTISFLIYGIGPDEQMLRTLATDLSVEERVRFMGQISHEHMPLMLKACSIFIRPSRSEGMGVSFIEAMAARLPVIATQEGGIVDFLFDEKKNPDKLTTGWAVEKDSPQQIVDAVHAIVANPEKVQKVTDAAHRMVTEKYEWDEIAVSMQQIFKELCKTPKTS